MFFFFKQKTAYEMRISDWSSDVCSSDLHARHLHRHGAATDIGKGIGGSGILTQEQRSPLGREIIGRQPVLAHQRSEEHTSELQSLMRISYAVFCLKKKKKLRPPQRYLTPYNKTRRLQFTQHSL